MRLHIYLLILVLAFSESSYGQVDAIDDFIFMTSSATRTFNILGNDINATGYTPVITGLPSGITVAVNGDGSINVTTNSSVDGNYSFTYTIGNCCSPWLDYVVTQQCNMQTDCTGYSQTCTTTTSSVEIPCPAGSGASYCTQAVVTTTCNDYCSSYSAPYEVCHNITTAIPNNSLCLDGSTERVCESATVNVYVTPATKDLAVTKSVNNFEFVVGDTVSFEIEVVNQNNLTVGGSNQVIDTLTSDFTYLNSTATLGSYAPGTGIWTIGSFTGGASETLIINAVVNNSGILSNCAYINSAQDTKIANNEICLSILSDNFTTVDTSGNCDVCTFADYQVTKTLVENGPFFPTDTIIFELEVSIANGDTAADVLVYDELQPNIVFISSNATQGSYNDVTGIWNIGELLDTQTLQIVARLIDINDDYPQNIATITSPTIDTSNNDNVAYVQVFLNEPAADIMVTKDVDFLPGIMDTLIYTITATNLGPIDASGTVITENTPSNILLADVSGGTFDSLTQTWDLGVLVVGESQTLTLTTVVIAGTQVVNNASISSNILDINTNNNIGSADFIRYICLDSSGYEFSVDSVFGATYTWIVPSSMSIISGQSTRNIGINTGSLIISDYIYCVVETDCSVDTAKVLLSMDSCSCADPISVISGDDQTICSGSDVFLGQATVLGSFTRLQWISNGSGGFDDDRILRPTYTPSAADVVNGTVVLSLYVEDPDSTGGCFGASNFIIVTINEMPQATSSENTNPSYCGASDGFITYTGLSPFTSINVSFTFEGVSYGPNALFTSGTGNLVIPNLIAGSYSDVVFEYNGCETYPNNFSLFSLSTFSVSITKSNPTVCGSSDGSATFSDLIPNSTYEFSIEYGLVDTVYNITTDASGNFELSDLSAGSYSSIQFVDDNCSSNVMSFDLYDPGAPIIVLDAITDATSCSVDDGTIIFSSLVANTAYEVYYNFEGSNVGPVSTTSNAFGNDTLFSLASGNYTDITYVTSAGCSSNAIDATIDAPNQPAITSTAVTDATGCNSAYFNGSIRIFGVGSAYHPYVVYYSFNGGAVQSVSVTGRLSTGLLLSSLAPGDYSDIYVVYAGCISNYLDAVVGQPDVEDLLVLSTTLPSICGENDGEVEFFGLEPSKTFNITYQLDGINQSAVNKTSNSTGNLIWTGLVSGIYSNVIFTLNGCESDAMSFTIDDASLIIAVTKVNPTGCGYSNGRIYIDDTNPSTAYTVSYSFNGSPVTITMTSNSLGRIQITSLGAGVYTDIQIIETSGNGCTSNSEDITLNNPGSTPIVTISSVGNPTACNSATGIIILTTGSNSTTNFNLSYDSLGVSVTRPVTSFTDGNIYLQNLYSGDYLNIRLALSPSTTCYSIPLAANLTDPSGTFIGVDSIYNTCSLAGTNGGIVISGGQPNTTYTLTYNQILIPSGTESSVSVSITTSVSGSFSLNGLSPGSYSQIAIQEPSTLCTSNSVSATVSLGDIITNLTVASTAASASCTVPNGRIILINAEPNTDYTVTYTYAGSNVSVTKTSSSTGEIILSGLNAGSYTSIMLNYGASCTTNAVNTVIEGAEPPKVYHIGCD